MLEPQDNSLKPLVFVLYILGALSYFTFISGIIGLIIAYVKRPDAQGSYLHYHFTWLINTFWVGLILWLLGTLTMIIFIGWIILLGGFIWVLYRLIKGGLRLNDNRSPYDFSS